MRTKHGIGYREPTTSKAAAEKVKPKSTKKAILTALRKHRAGMTVGELSAHMMLPELTVQPRISDLYHIDKLVAKATNKWGEPLVRENKRGNKEQVWKLAR